MTAKGKSAALIGRPRGGKRRISPPFGYGYRAGRRRSGAEVEGAGFGDHYDHRKLAHPSATRSLEHGTPDRPEASAEAEGRLDNSSAAAAGRTETRSRD